MKEIKEPSEEEVKKANAKYFAIVKYTPTWLICAVIFLNLLVTLLNIRIFF